MNQRFFDYLVGEREAHRIQARKQKPDYLISQGLSAMNVGEGDKPGRVRFLEKRFARINYAAMLLANKIRHGYLDEVSSEKLDRRGSKAANDFETNYDLNDEYMSYFLDANPDYCRYVKASSDNISKMRQTLVARMKLDRFFDRLQRKGGIGLKCKRK